MKRNPNAAAMRAAMALLAACAAAGLAACSASLLPRPEQAPARYTLDAAAAAPAQPAGNEGRAAPPAGAGRAGRAGVPGPAGPAGPAGPEDGILAPTLTVELPRAAPGHDSRHMVYQRQPQELQAFAFHEWVAPPAQLLAPLLLRALQDSAAFRVVLAAPATAAAGWQLQTEGLRLVQDFTQRPSRVRLSLRAVLMDGRTRQALAWREFDISVAAAADDPVAGARAAQQAAQTLAAEVAAFCVAARAAQAGDGPR